MTGTRQQQCRQPTIAKVQRRHGDSVALQVKRLEERIELQQIGRQRHQLVLRQVEFHEHRHAGNRQWRQLGEGVSTEPQSREAGEAALADQIIYPRRRKLLVRQVQFAKGWSYE